jgi:hypothetical protein
MSAAFKEWQVIVEALAAGEQIILLRKGGIAEDQSVFDPAHATRFWLFPTQFHAQREKTKPAAARWFAKDPRPADRSSITLRYFADIVRHRFLDTWDDVVALDSFHCWTETAIREKFDWSHPPGLHAFVVRVYRANTPVTLPLAQAMAGCKTWIDVPAPFPADSTPVIDSSAFAQRLIHLGETTRLTE